MPARVVDGDSLWRSKKLKNVPVEFRAEYANLLSLAQANGVFECEPDQVWADVYAFNRPDVDAARVVQILDALEHAELLFRWEQSGKVYGYWVGIEKTGRLPTGAHLKRYKNLPPNPPAHFWASDQSRIIPDESRNMPEGFGIGLVRCGMGVVQETAPTLETKDDGQDVSEEEDMKAKTELQVLSLRLLGEAGGNNPDYWGPVKVLEQAFRSHAVCECFATWAQEAVG